MVSYLTTSRCGNAPRGRQSCHSVEHVDRLPRTPPVSLAPRFRGSNHIDINLVQRSALLRASRRTATGEVVPPAILRDARQGGAVLWIRSLGSEFHPSFFI